IGQPLPSVAHDLVLCIDRLCACDASTQVIGSRLLGIHVPSTNQRATDLVYCPLLSVNVAPTITSFCHVITPLLRTLGTRTQSLLGLLSHHGCQHEACL